MSIGVASNIRNCAAKVIGLATEHRASTVLIENAGPGMNLLQDLRAAVPQGMTRPIGVKPEGSKVDRMAAQSAKIEAGHVHLPISAPWLAEFLAEVLSFPNGRHDDRSIAFLSSSDGCRTMRIIRSPLSRRSSSPDREKFSFEVYAGPVNWRPPTPATLGQTYEPEVPVEMREWISPASASSDLVF
jgi:predicted phage terminase large subunit-like protein